MASPTPGIIDWSRVKEEVRCPFCDYNLRGLDEPRCPECGGHFNWDTLLDPKHRLHPYLFEHNLDQDTWSFLRTAVGGLRPEQFWRKLSLAQPSQRERLVVYWCISLIPLLILLFALAGLVMVRVHTRNSALRAGRTGPAMDWDYPLAPSDRFFDIALDEVCRSGALLSTAGACCGVAAWPWVTYVVLNTFREAMRQAKIKPIHVLRTVIYSADVTLWAALAAMAYAYAGYARDCVKAGAATADLRLNVPLVLILLFVPLFVWRLSVAYRCYLRVEQPSAIIIVSQILAAFLLLGPLILLVWFVLLFLI